MTFWEQRRNRDFNISTWITFFTFKKKVQFLLIIERQACVGMLSHCKHRGKACCVQMQLHREASSCPVAAILSPAHQCQLGSRDTAMPAAFIGTAMLVRDSTSLQSQSADTSCSQTRNYMTYLSLKRLVGNNAEVWEHWQEDCYYLKLAIFYIPERFFYNGIENPQVSFKIKLSVTILHVQFDDGLTPRARCCKIFWIHGRSGLQYGGGFYSTLNPDSAPIL